MGSFFLFFLHRFLLLPLSEKWAKRTGTSVFRYSAVNCARTTPASLSPSSSYRSFSSFSFSYVPHHDAMLRRGTGERQVPSSVSPTLDCCGSDGSKEHHQGPFAQKLSWRSSEPVGLCTQRHHELVMQGRRQLQLSTGLTVRVRSVERSRRCHPPLLGAKAPGKNQEE